MRWVKKAVFLIRGSLGDNYLVISAQKHILCHLNCFDEVVQMRGHNICFQGKITTNILKFSLVLSEALGKVMCFQIPEDYTSVNLH